MRWTFDHLYGYLKRSGVWRLLGKSNHGLERECLRVDARGLLSRSPHPRVLGSALCHPLISTDFCESQLELITPTFPSEQGAIDCLDELHHFIHQHLPHEMLWPSSTPCAYPEGSEIPVATYGGSSKGLQKLIYRKGLVRRYGAKMQTLCGVHYNFSLSPDFWNCLRGHFAPTAKSTDFVSQCYLHMCRNFFRVAWIDTLLFGATPACDVSYLDSIHEALQPLDSHTLYGATATSIRNSVMGYSSAVQDHLPITYNTLEGFVDGLEAAVNTVSPQFRKFGLYEDGEQTQLNENYLQIEAEHYTAIRPKAHLQGSERVVDALRRGGIVYLEVRAVDVDPFSRNGVSVDHLRFLHMMLLSCLLHSSAPFDDNEASEWKENFAAIALCGRDPASEVRIRGEGTSTVVAAREYLARMHPVAELLDGLDEGKVYQRCLELQLAKLEDLSLTPSAQVLKTILGHAGGHQGVNVGIAKRQHAEYLKAALTAERNAELEAVAAESLRVAEALEPSQAS